MNFKYTIADLSPDELEASGAFAMMRRMRDVGIPMRIEIALGAFHPQSWVDLFESHLLVTSCELRSDGSLILMLSAAERTLH